MTRLQAIQEREQKATKGPWLVYVENTPTLDDAKRELTALVDGTPIFTEQVVMIAAPNGLAPAITGCGERSLVNAEFIANNRDDVPWLLARVEQMRSVIASEVAMCFGCHGSGCDSCKALCDALCALDEEVAETVQS
jgi:hypothetical protein